MMNASDLTKEWTQQRYEYYLSGRTLWFHNQSQPGAIMLGYAVEAHLKHGMNVHKSSFPPKLFNRLIYKHDIPTLFERSRAAGLFSDVEVSGDLLLFVQDNFHRRYPSQTQETARNARCRGHFLANTPALIHAYDDFILQLDWSLYRSINDIRASVTLMGAKGVKSLGDRLFFHSNHAAIDQLTGIQRLLDEDWDLFSKEEDDDERLHALNKPEYLERRVHLSDANNLLMAEHHLISVPRQPNTTFRVSAKAFAYPGRYYELPDGSVGIATFRGSISLPG
jgi:hypothetical protein